MTKLEAWKAWCVTAGTERLADQFTLENSSHGKAFSFAWDAAHEACEKLCRKEAERALFNFKNDLSVNEPFWNGAEQMAANLANDIQSRK